ncbi:MAG: hypothetical protein Q7T25_01170 [Sideroxyarcus sp.]|nr:hypothetical protein [Sideroxyarcus sp.]
MKLKATFAPRRDGAYGRVVDTTDAIRMTEGKSYLIDDNGIVDVPDEFAQHLIDVGNFTRVDEQEPGPPAGNDASALLITNGDTTVDLMALDKPGLLAIANEMNLGMNGKDNMQNLRAAIHAHANKPIE